MTSNTASPSQPQHLTRRQPVEAERHAPTQRRTRNRRSVVSNHRIEKRPAVAAPAERPQPIPGGIAVLAAAPLIGTYALPAYGNQPREPEAVKSASTQPGGAVVQSLQVANEAGPSGGDYRDGSQVTKVLPPGFRPYTVTAKVGSVYARSTGPHLHFEIRENGTPVDSSTWLKAKVGR